MAKKARQSISYVLEHAKSSAGGHRLGVNSLAVDLDNSILYSGGRDGVICAWDLDLDLRRRAGHVQDDAESESKPKPKPATKFRAQTQAHMHWTNDITLVQNNAAVVSGSSDFTVKVWRPSSHEDNTRAHSIGEHSDYVKCVATPPSDMNVNWVASGSLDRKICLWDLNGGGKTLEIDVRGEPVVEKGSVYALAVGRNLIASGGPEKIVRLYDPRTGSRVSKLVGHVDNIRSILIGDSGDTILSSSADKTIKMWSIKEGRCMYTFTMHDESVWSLFSDDPQLGIFYSSDRSGLIAKTDVRGSFEDIDHGLSVAVAHEHIGVMKLVAAGGHIWTATPRSSINRWQDVDTTSNAQPQGAASRRQRSFSAASENAKEQPPAPSGETAKKGISAKSILKISNTAALPPPPTRDAESETLLEQAPRRLSTFFADPQPDIHPVQQMPEETIEGQFGLTNHKLLNDRRRVLTLDTAGDVVMWDLIQCKPIQSFGKQDFDEVERVVNTREAVAPWCTVSVSSGNLTVVLEPYNCFDAEVYVDQLNLETPIDFREDQRVSLGKWVLRYLFANLIEEEIRRDEAHRQKLNEDVEKRQGSDKKDTVPLSITIPRSSLSDIRPSDELTPRASGPLLRVTTPGSMIGLASPVAISHLQGVPEQAILSPRGKDSSETSADRDDYFTGSVGPTDSLPKVSDVAAVEAEPTASGDGNDRSKDKDKAADGPKSPSTPFGKKFRMSFSSKKIGRPSFSATREKVVAAEEKAEESESSSSHEKEVDDSFLGVIQKVRNEYEKQILEVPDKAVETRITPSLPSETPVLRLPPGTKVFIQEETSGGSANLYHGTIENVGRDADLIEQKAPMWLGDVLLLNQIPLKDPVKISFILHPMGDLPPISADGNSRLNANRMLRVKKILAYIAERIDADLDEEDPKALKAEEYLELYCYDEMLNPTMSLATLRTHIWKGGNDVVLYYRANGRKEIRPRHSQFAEAKAPGPAAAESKAPQPAT
ncbi:UBP9-binding protein bun107 [Escovopsis weberi]|uniref:UBP9-binding protein bun107 n=1 Tax=Escovopsis weberi TaxID=150374 RepID=A0A0M9VT64_ESCWE|nr:UBP9-binding protein bun107 [Escovopsis weberi]